MPSTAAKRASSVLVRVQHHPARADLLPRLLPGLEGMQVEVSEHSSTPPSPWLGYRRCLSDLPPECEHVLVVQDDAIPCHNLPPAVERIVKAIPSCPVALFLGRFPLRTKKYALQAAQAGLSYVEIHPQDFIPCVATIWPRYLAEDLVSWQDAQRVGRHPVRADDGVTWRWHRARKQTAYATIPSLFEHPDDVPSVKGVASPPNRTALVPIQHRDPLDIDWSFA